MILISKSDMWLNPSILECIGSPTHILIFSSQEERAILIGASDSSNPEAVEITASLVKGLPLENQQWLGMDVPEDLIQLLPDNGCLELPGVQISSDLLLFRLDNGVPCSFEEVFKGIKHAIVPPGWSYSEKEFLEQAYKNRMGERFE